VVLQAVQELRDPQVSRVLLVPQVSQVLLVLLEYQDLLNTPDLLISPGLVQDYQDQLVLRETQDQWEPQDYQELMVLRVQTAHQGEWDPLAPLGFQAFLGLLPRWRQIQKLLDELKRETRDPVVPLGPQDSWDQ